MWKRIRKRDWFIYFVVNLILLSTLHSYLIGLVVRLYLPLLQVACLIRSDFITCLIMSAMTRKVMKRKPFIRQQDAK